MIYGLSLKPKPNDSDAPAPTIFSNQNSLIDRRCPERTCRHTSSHALAPSSRFLFNEAEQLADCAAADVTARTQDLPCSGFGRMRTQASDGARDSSRTSLAIPPERSLTGFAAPCVNLTWLVKMGTCSSCSFVTSARSPEQEV